MADSRRQPPLRVHRPLAQNPFGPFLDGPGTPAHGPLIAAGLAEEALIYRALFHASKGNIGPRDADRLYLWEIAVLLGVETPELPALDNGANTAAAPGKARAMELVRQRMAHARGQGPAPEANPVDPAAFSQLAGAL